MLGALELVSGACNDGVTPRAGLAACRVAAGLKGAGLVDGVRPQRVDDGLPREKSHGHYGLHACGTCVSTTVMDTTHTYDPQTQGWA